MNKRIRKKHKWLGVKRAGANNCANEIARHIGRKILYSGITPKPSYILNVRRYIRWFFHHSSEGEWVKRVGEAYYPAQMFFSVRHLLPPDYYTSFDGRYKPNPPLKDMLDDLAENLSRKEKLLSGENVLIDDQQSLTYRLRWLKEYDVTGSLSQEEETDDGCIV